MSVINAIKTEQCAYLATDGASFYLDGSIASLGEKKLTYAGLRQSIGYQGAGSPDLLASAIFREVASPLSQANILLSLSPALRALRAKQRIDNPAGETTGTNETRMFIAAFLDIEDRPALFTISTDENPIFPGVQPYVLTEFQGIAIPMVDLAPLLPTGYVTDAAAQFPGVFLAQRRFPFPHIAGGCGVGGHCTMDIVSSGGVSRQLLTSFPEGVGDFPDRDWRP